MGLCLILACCLLAGFQYLFVLEPFAYLFYWQHVISANYRSIGCAVICLYCANFTAHQASNG
jgi:hypothetical protein